MLWIVRKINQGIKIGDNIKISVVKINNNSVKFGIDAPNFKIQRFDFDNNLAKSKNHEQTNAISTLKLNCQNTNFNLSNSAIMTLKMPKKHIQNLRINLTNEITKQNEQAALTNKNENLSILEKFISLFRLKKYLLS